MLTIQSLLLGTVAAAARLLLTEACCVLHDWHPSGCSRCCCCCPYCCLLVSLAAPALPIDSALLLAFNFWFLGLYLLVSLVGFSGLGYWTTLVRLLPVTFCCCCFTVVAAALLVAAVSFSVAPLSVSRWFVLLLATALLQFPCTWSAWPLHYGPATVSRWWGWKETLM